MVCYYCRRYNKSGKDNIQVPVEQKMGWKMPRQDTEQVLKNSYEKGGLKAPDIVALDSALKVKQYINATSQK